MTEILLKTINCYSVRTTIQHLLFCSCLFLSIKGITQSSVEYFLKTADSSFKANNYSLSHKNYINVYKKAEAEKDYKNVVTALRGVGACYYYMHDKGNALKWFYEYFNCVNTYKIDSLLSDAYYIVGVIYIEKENLDSVKKYIYPAVYLMKAEKNYSNLSRIYSTLAELHINKTKDYNKVEHYLKLAESYADASNDKKMVAFAATKHYNYYFREKKDYNKALLYINKAEKILEEIGEREAITNAYRGKAECLIMLKDTLAKEYISKWFKYKDSIFDANKASEVAKYEELYNAEKREAENLRLKQQNKINTLEIEKRNRTISILILILLLLLLLTLWWYNRSNIKNKQQEMLLMEKNQREKERIARDLHDNVGGQLSYLITNLEWIANHPESINNFEELSKKLINFSEIGRNAILTLRETIWAVSNEELNIIDFTDRFKNYILKLQITNHIKITFIENFENPQNLLRPEQALNIFRICQEAFHNALKHSKANEIIIHFESTDSCLFKFTIEDNGVGFDYNERYKNGHYGMKNMKERAKESNAEIQINSELNNGTKISICVKYPNANDVL